MRGLQCINCRADGSAVQWIGLGSPARLVFGRMLPPGASRAGTAQGICADKLGRDIHGRRSKADLRREAGEEADM